MPIVSMDVFLQDAFKAQNLTATIDKEGFVPTLLGSIPGLFVPPPMGQPRSQAFFIEDRYSGPAIIHTTPRGSEPTAGRTDEPSRTARPFKTERILRSRRITATEIAGIRAFGQINELQSLELMVQRYQYLMQERDFPLTWEWYRLNTVTQAKMLDADGTVIWDWAAQFGQVVPNIVTWTLPATNAANDGTVAGLCSTAVRAITRALKGLGGVNVEVHAICGDSFYDALRGCAEVRETFKYQQGEELRAARAWREFYYGGIVFHNYRGTDDNSTVAVGVKKCYMFPAGAGIFQEVYSPADERFEFEGSPGIQAYSWVVPDLKRNMYVDVEMASYPATVCTMPQALYSAQIA